MLTLLVCTFKKEEEIVLYPTGVDVWSTKSPLTKPNKTFWCLVTESEFLQSYFISLSQWVSDVLSMEYEHLFFFVKKEHVLALFRQDNQPASLTAMAMAFGISLAVVVTAYHRWSDDTMHCFFASVAHWVAQKDQIRVCLVWEKNIVAPKKIL